MFSRQQHAKRCSKEISLALNILGFSTSMVRWRQIHYDTRMKRLTHYGAEMASRLQDFSYHIFLTGSKQEGTSIWGGGDEDVMMVLDRYICVHDHNNTTAEPGGVYICIEDIEHQPGYMFLKRAPFTKLNTKELALDKFIDICINKDSYLSSQMINKISYYMVKSCEKSIENERDLSSDWISFETSDSEYPSIVCRFRGLGEHTIDFLVGAFICGTPTTALKEWASRKRNNWPSKTVIDRIVNMPSYVVPKGLKGSENRGLEFRISYTFSELELIKALNETQLKVYILLKMLFQSEVNEQFPDIITSYCLKNVVFWMCETENEFQFETESLLVCFAKGLNNILEYIRKGNLPMYLMPKRNLLEGKLDTENKPRLEKLLSDLIMEGPDVLERVRKIQTVVQTLRSDVVVAIAMGYMLHRGEMFLVNDRDETLKSTGPRVIPACLEMLYTKLHQVSMK